MPIAPSSTSTTWGGRPTCSSGRPTSGADDASGSNAEKQATALRDQAERMRAKATKAKAAQGMLRRADRLTDALEGARKADRVAKIRFPEPAVVWTHPLTAQSLSKSYGSLEVFTDVDLAVDRGSRVVVLGLNGAGKTTLLRMLAGVEEPDTGCGRARPRSAAGLLRAGARDARPRAQRAGEPAVGLPERSANPMARSLLGGFLFTGDTVYQPAGTLSGGEKTAWHLPAWSCRAPTCCCWTSRPTTSTRRAEKRSWLRFGATPVPSCWSRTTRGGRGSRPGATHPCCRTASRTCGRPTTPIWSRSPEDRATDPSGRTRACHTMIEGTSSRDEEADVAPQTKGRRITGDERGTLSAELRRQYEQGSSIRTIAADTGRSYGFVHRVLMESGTTLRRSRRSDPRTKQ